MTTAECRLLVATWAAACLHVWSCIMLKTSYSTQQLGRILVYKNMTPTSINVMISPPLLDSFEIHIEQHSVSLRRWAHCVAITELPQTACAFCWLQTASFLSAYSLLAARIAPVMAPLVIEFQGSSFPRTFTKPQSIIEKRPPHTAKLPAVQKKHALWGFVDPTCIPSASNTHQTFSNEQVQLVSILSDGM